MRKVFLYSALYFQTFIRRHKSQLGFSILIGFFLTLFIFQIYPLLSALIIRKHENIGIVGSYSWNNLPMPILNKISIGLTSVSSDGQAGESAATSWDILNNLIYTFHLKPNLTWHDGTKFNAGDIKYKIKDSNISVIDNYTLKITIKEPFSPLPVYLSAPLMKDKHIGLGPYKVVRVIYNNGNKISALTLLPFDKKASTITYKFYKNADDALIGFKLGEVDTLENIDSKEIFNNWQNLDIEAKSDYNRVVSLFFNFKESKLKEKEIRQALAYGVPLFEQYDKAASPLSPFSWAYSQKLRLYKNDLETAKKILSKSPLASSSSELILTTQPSLLKIAEKIVDSWNKIGIYSKIKVDSTIPSDYQVLLRSMPIPPDPDQYLYWQSTQENTNISNYSSPKIDKLLEDGRKTSDMSERKKIYADFQFYLVDDAPAIFLFYPKLYTVKRK